MPPDQGFDQLGGAVALPGGIGGERQGDEIGQGFAIQVVAPSREQDAAAGGVLRQGEGEGVGLMVRWMEMPSHWERTDCR